MADAEAYIRGEGPDANARGARHFRITPGMLSSLILKHLNDLEDVLLTAKLYDAFVAAIKIKEHRSRLYVLRLLLERVPADRLGALRALVDVLAKLAPGGGGGGGEHGVMSLDEMVRAVAPRMLRRLTAAAGDPSGTADIPQVAVIVQTLVKERAYLLLKGAAVADTARQGRNTPPLLTST